MWTISADPVDSPDTVTLLRDYFVELTVRYFHPETTKQEIDLTLDEFPSTGLAPFLVLRARGYDLTLDSPPGTQARRS
jgi:hypothetical protein